MAKKKKVKKISKKNQVTVSKKITDKKSDSFQKNMIIFLIKFFLIYSILYFILLTFKAEPLQYFLATIQHYLTGFEQQGFFLIHPQVTFFISEQCTGLVSGIILVALVLAGRKPDFKKKATILFIGLLTLLLLNIIRVYLVLQLGALGGSELAETVHVASWFVMTGAILVLWYYLTQKIGNISNVSDVV